MTQLSHFAGLPRTMRSKLPEELTMYRIRFETLAVLQNALDTRPMEIGESGGRGRCASVFCRPGLAKHPIGNVSDRVHSGGDRTRQTTDVSGRLGPSRPTADVHCTDSDMAPPVLSAPMASSSRREKSRRSDLQVTHPDGYVGLPGGRSAQFGPR